MNTNTAIIRLIKRYGGGSRKLYDTEESRYVSLDELAAWVRAGQELKVVDSATGEDVTAQTLAQVIYETQKSGTVTVSSDLLAEVIRRGGMALSQQAQQLRAGVDRLMKKGAARLAADTPAEVAALRRSLEQLERSLAGLEAAGTAPGPTARRRARTRTKPDPKRRGDAA